MTRPFVPTLIRHAVLDSTNDLARQLAVAGRSDLPLVVRADRQTRGRGRGAHAWWSDAGSLTFSILIAPDAHGLRPEHEPRLALATAVAVIEAIAEPSLGIRWPNDIESGGRKLGGILPERVETPAGPRLVIGIGLNVATRLADAPDDVRHMAASLADMSQTPIADEPLFLNILERFGSVLSRLAADDPSLAASWERLDTLRDTWVKVDLGPRIVEGFGRGIDPEGALLLATDREPLCLFGGQVLRGPQYVRPI